MEDANKNMAKVKIGMNVDWNELITSDSFTISIPNTDERSVNFDFFPKEVVQKSYIYSIGKTIDFCGVPKKIISVKITENSIFVELIPGDAEKTGQQPDFSKGEALIKNQTYTGFSINAGPKLSDLINTSIELSGVVDRVKSDIDKAIDKEIERGLRRNGLCHPYPLSK